MKRFGRGSTAGGAVLALLALTTPLRAQVASVAVEEENFRSEPRGSILAELLEGTSLSLGEERDSWRQATVEGWIWARSVREQEGGDLDLIVNAGGENLRAAPNGDRIGRALGGTRLERLESQGDWVRVRRTGWIWAPSLGPIEAEPAPGASGPAVQRGSRDFAAVPEAVIIVDSPGGDTVARLSGGTLVEVVAREGEWSRVRVEGWTFSGALEPPDSLAGGVLRDISRDSLQAHPERYRGRIIEWSVQFIALEEAERFRTDFLEGEPFMLTRGPGEDPGFVYIAVGPERLAEVQAISPLRRIRVIARVRTARSTLTGAPVLDLLEIPGS